MEEKIEQLLEICDDNEIRTKFIHWDNILKEIQLSEEFLDNFVVNLDLRNLRFDVKIKREWSLICYHQNLSEEFIRKHYKDIDWVAISVSQNLSKEFMIEFGNKLSCNDLIIYQKNIDEDVIKIIGKNFDIKNDSDVNMMESFIKIYHSIPNLHELLVNIKNNK